MPTTEALQVFYGSIPLIAVILMAVFVNNKRIDDIRDSLGKRIDDVGKRIDDLKSSVESRLSSIENRLTEIEKSQRVIR